MQKNIFLNKKFALVGKNIGHSKSSEVYQRILGLNLKQKNIDVDHFNYEEIPKILNECDWLNLTSPFKKIEPPDFLSSFINKAEGPIKDLFIFNLAVKKEDKVFLYNTDFFALLFIVNEINSFFPNHFFKILGDGNTSKILQRILSKVNLPYQVISRRNNFISSTLEVKNQVVINCNERGFDIMSYVDSHTRLVFDLNYQQEKSSISTSEKFKFYDGEQMLFLQAHFNLMILKQLWNS